MLAPSTGYKQPLNCTPISTSSAYCPGDLAQLFLLWFHNQCCFSLTYLLMQSSLINSANGIWTLVLYTNKCIIQLWNILKVGIPVQPLPSQSCCRWTPSYSAASRADRLQVTPGVPMQLYLNSLVAWTLLSVEQEKRKFSSTFWYNNIYGHIHRYIY